MLLINRKPNKPFLLSLYSITHAVVDACCFFLIMGGIDAREKIATYIVSYNILAFGLQLPLGWFIDKIKKPAAASALGCIILILGLFMYHHALVATILAGIGNALFHVGGGTISLNLNRRKAALPGIFVSTGTLGLFVGVFMAKQIHFQPVLPAIILISLALTILTTQSPRILYKSKKTDYSNLLLITLILLLITISIRSTVGLSLNFPWKSNMQLLLLFTIGITLGKAFGGFLSDRFGWIKVSVFGLVISSVLLFWGSQHAIAGILGILFFNFTMPVTLVAISNLLEGKPGFSFGLTTFALIIGALPTFFKNIKLFSDIHIILILTLTSAILLYAGLIFYKTLLTQAPRNKKAS